jgi:hypothetical protein
MSRDQGDPEKQPPECKALGRWKHKCPNLKERQDFSMEGETYDCEVCGEHMFLDYEEMK